MTMDPVKLKELRDRAAVVQAQLSQLAIHRNGVLVEPQLSVQLYRVDNSYHAVVCAFLSVSPEPDTAMRILSDRINTLLRTGLPRSVGATGGERIDLTPPVVPPSANVPVDPPTPPAEDSLPPKAVEPTKKFSQEEIKAASRQSQGKKK